MPAYPWLASATIDPASMEPRMKALRTLGVPYSDADIAGAGEAVKGKTELDALIAYLQSLGHALK
jgi:cytochrome c oxidase cbb3-type subunit 2